MILAIRNYTSLRRLNAKFLNNSNYKLLNGFHLKLSSEITSYYIY